MPEADPRVSNLRILGKLDGPLVATPVNILEGIEKALRVLSAGATNNRLYGQFITLGISSSVQLTLSYRVFGEQFRATCDKVKASIDRLLSLQDALVEELTTKKDEVRTILSEESDPAKHRLPLICFGQYLPFAERLTLNRWGRCLQLLGLVNIRGAHG